MAARSSVIALLALACLAACDRPQFLLICHNSNCVEPTNPANDDSVPAMRESLALTIDGKPAIDGIEIDVFWRGADSACLFAHDLDAERTTLADEAATELAAHIAANPTLTASGEPFSVFIEMKPHVAAEKTARHTPEQRVQHADCVWRLYDTIAAAAVANARDVEIVVGSFAPDLLRALIARTPASTPIPYRFGATYGIPKPLDPQTHPLSDYEGLPISIVEMHPQWIHDAQYEGILSQDVDLMFWMFSATTETLQAIEQYEPKLVGTSEANFLRRWLLR
jgi:hypothetical protein